VIRRDTVTPVPLAELAYCWQNGIELIDELIVGFDGSLN